MIKYTNSEGGYHEKRTPFHPDYLCHSDNSVSEFHGGSVHVQNAWRVAQ